MSPYTMYNQSDLRVADTDFIRCRQISLQYDLPDAWVNKIGVRRASVNASLVILSLLLLTKHGKDVILKQRIGLHVGQFLAR